MLQLAALILKRFGNSITDPRDYRGHAGIIGYTLGSYWDNGNENGHYKGYRGLYTGYNSAPEASKLDPQATETLHAAALVIPVVIVV